MEVEVRDQDFFRLVDPHRQIEQVATGFDFVEGPVWHPTYHSVIFSDILGNSLYSWRADGGVVKRKQHSYLANGNAYDPYGRLVTCEHATSRLSRTDLTTGHYEVLATHFEGKQLNSPNDVVVKQDGRIYFTDPTSGRSATFGIPREPDLPFCGLFHLDPEGDRLDLLAADFAKPNGLCFSPDESRLFVSDSDRQHIRVLTVTDNGGLANGRLFANFVSDKPGVADGMKVDSEGHLYACGPGGIHIFTAEGTCLGVIATPEFAANLVFGDEDLRTLYITATNSLYRLRVKIPGWATYSPKPAQS